MKKLKIFITIFASLLLILLFNNISYASDYNGVSGLNEFIKQNAGASMIGKTISISHSDLENSKYVYCVAYHKRFRQTVEFKVQHYVELEGEIARIPSLGIDNVKNTYNIILSEILSGKYGTGYGKLENYSDAQIALYAYFNPWLDEGKFWYNGGVRTMREVCGLDSTWGTKPTNAPDEWDIPNSIISEIYDVAGGRSSLDTGEGREKVYKYYNQKVRLYFIDVVGAVNHQKLLIAIPAPIEIRMNVYKIDKNTRQPLANVGFQVKNSKGQYLFYNEGTSKIEYVDEANAGTFYSDSNGYVRISGVNADTYEFIETEPIANYETSKGKSITVAIKSGEYKKTVTFENEKKNGSKEIIVEKVWNDNDDYFKKRPKSIEVQLLQNGKNYKKETITPDDYKEKIWTHTFKDLPEFDKNGNEYQYSVIETSEIYGYKSIIREAETNKKFIITNNYQHANIDIEVIKKWYDSNSGNRPGSVTVKLLADKEEIDSAKLSSNNNWQHTFKDLPAVKKNIHVEYSVYAGTFDDVRSVKITLYKYDKNKKENIKVDSQSDNGEYGSVEFLHLPVYENGEEIEYIIKGSAYIEEDGSWFGGGRKYWKTLSDYELDITEEEKAVEYDIKEINVPGYTSLISISDDGTKYTITNRAKGYGNVTISGKVWLDMPDGKANKNDGKYDSNSKDELLENVIVHWKDKNGNEIASTTTNADGYYEMRAEIEIPDHLYDENGINMVQYNKINNSYVEFEYNGLKYTTVAAESSGASTSKAIEDEKSRRDLDYSFDEVNNKGVLDAGNLYRTRYMERHTADLEYDYTDHKSTLRQGNADFPVTASTGDVIKGLLSNYSEAHPIPHVRCAYQEWVPDEDDNGGGEWVHRDGSRIDEWEIKNVNLGLVLREQPDMAITSDIDHVTVIMKNQEYTYYYKGRATAPSDELFDYKVKFSGKYTQEYKRPINPSDISYINYDGNNPEDLQVYVTYNVKVTNQSKTLPIKVQEIVNYYDAKYDEDYVEDADNGWTHSSKYNDIYDDGNGIYKAIYNQELTNEIIRPGGTKTIQVKHKVETETVKSLIKGEDILIKSVFEIYSYSSYYGEDTLYAEDQKAGNLGISGMQNSGVDLDSAPGSAKMQLVQGQNGKPELDTESFEDDTDMAPTFVLCEDPNYKIMTGTVYEDTSITNDGQRLGNGIKDGTEKGVEGVQVQLLKLNNNGTVEPAYLYKIGTSPTSEAIAERRLAVTWTGPDGDYSFGESRIEGVVVDNYVIKYTYGNGTTTEISGEANGTIETVGSRQLQAKINGNVINARNYKSTIVTTNPIQDVMKRNISGTNITTEDLKWHLTAQDDASIAVDDIDNLHWKFVTDDGQLVDVDISNDEDARLRIDSLKYSNFDDGKNVSAYSLPVKVQIEYDTKTQDSTLKQEQGSNGEINIGGLEFVGEGEITSGDLTNGKDYENNWSKFDFGIIERPRENIVIDKTIQNIKITLANGQVLTEGNPYEKKLNYVKAMGTKNVTTRERSIDAHDKLLYIEMDSELIQGARLDILYAITVTNNSEIDYEYEEALGGNEKYYYYGEVASDLIKPSVELVVDYMDPELSCTVGAGTEYNKNWQQVQADTDLHDNGYISDETYNTVKREAGNYSIFITSVFKDLARGESHTENLFASKLLANQATEYTYENHVEIIQLNGKIARNIDSVEENTREQITKQYKPGTYVPDLDRINADSDSSSEAVQAGLVNGGITGWGTVDGTIEHAGFHTQDDDMITIRITPPTGLENNMIIYISAGVVGLIVIAVGIYFIKKKVIG